MDKNPNRRIKEMCEGKRLRIEKVIHLGAAAGYLETVGHASMSPAEEAIEDLLGDLDSKQVTDHIKETISGLRITYDDDPDDASGEWVDTVYDFLEAAISSNKLGVLILVHSPAIDSDENEGSWGWCALGWFYGETLLEAVEVAAERMPAYADRRNKAASPGAGHAP